VPAPGSFIGNTLGEAAAFAAGIAVGPLLAPLVRSLENETWSEYPTMPLNAQTVAQGVAEGKPGLTDAVQEAALTGLSENRFNLLVDLMRTGPGIAQGITLIRRGQLSPNDFVTVLTRAGLEQQWITAYQQLSTTQLEPWEQPLSPADLALGLIRGNLESFQAPDGPAFPPGGSTEGGLVPHDPVSGIDVVAEAAASGIDAERMAVLARNVGLPPGVIEGLRMWNRGIINEADFYLLIEQSDARLSWGPFLAQLKREILTPHEYAELYLRGWITQAEAEAGAAMSGLNQSDTDLLIDMIGRPVSLHQITTGLERGGVWDGTPQLDVPEPYLKMLQESNIRPEWYSLAYANRFTYPGYFVLKPLVQSGAITVSQATTYLLYQGWEPDLAAFTAESFAAAGPTASSPVKSAYTKLRTAAEKAYVAGASTVEQATSDLEAAGVSASDAATIIAAWDQIIAIEARTTPPAEVAPPAGG
jgi:hypothetical protein